MGFDWSWNSLLKNAAQQGMEGYRPGTLQAPQGYVPYEATLNQRGLSNNMQPDNSVIPGTTYRPDNFGNRQPQAVTQMEAEQQAKQEAAAKQQRIASIQSEIKVLEQRIADNTMKLRNFTGNADKIAAIEARKIYSQDPTSIWRWKTDKEEARRLANTEKNKAEDIAKASAQYEITNTLAAIRPNALMDSATQQRYLQQLADLKTMAQKNKLSTDAIDTKIKEVLGETSDDTGKTKAELASIDWKGLKNKPGVTSSEVRDMIPNIIDPAEKKEAENFALELEKKEAAKAYEKKWNAYLEDYEEQNGRISDKFKATLRRIYDKKNKKG